MRHAIKSALLGAAAALALACEDSSPPRDAVEIVRATNSGDGQTGTVGHALPARLRVLVTDGGRPSEGAAVAWSTTGGGKLSAAGPTGADGIAEADWTLGSAAGEQTAQATVADAAGSPLAFSATAQPGPAAQLLRIGPGAYEAGVHSSPEELQVQVRDELGNAIAGVTVDWAVESGDASVQPASAVTGDDGNSRAAVTLGASTGPSVITATAEGLQGSPVQFVVTARLYVFVEDNYFSPDELTVTAGTTVTWYWAEPFRAHNVVPDQLEPTRSGDPVYAGTGHDEYSFTFETPGTYRYYCQNHGLPGGGGMSGIIHVTP
jgi:plastocyanin